MVRLAQYGRWRAVRKGGESQIALDGRLGSRTKVDDYAVVDGTMRICL